jgi:maltose-binding protein MalE
MKKSALFLFALVLLVLVGMVFAPITRAQDATATPAPTATFVPSAEGTLTLWTDQGRSTAVETMGKDFTAKYNVPVRVQVMGFGDVRNNLQLGGPVGQGPDLIVGAHDWIGQLYSNGLISDIELPKEIADKFDPVALQAFTYDGKLVGLPYLTEAVGIYYNPDIISGVPETWAETIKLAEQVVADKKAERGIAIPNGAGDPYHHYALITGFGGYVFGRDQAGNYDPKDLGIDSPGAIKAAEEIDRLVKADVLNAAVGYGEAQTLFTGGKLAMWVTGPWALGDIRKSGVKYAVAPLPKMDDVARPFVGSQGFMVNKFSKNELLAKAFLTEYVATDTGMELLYKSVPFIPAWKPLADKLEDQDLKNFAKSVANGQPMPAIPQMAAVWSSWGNAITLIYQQKEAPDKAMKDAGEAIRKEIEKVK